MAQSREHPEQEGESRTVLPEAGHSGRWHAGRMQWHWGNIGSAAAGLAALIATLAAV
jgi:hypothetical protein